MNKFIATRQRRRRGGRGAVVHTRKCVTYAPQYLGDARYTLHVRSRARAPRNESSTADVAFVSIAPRILLAAVILLSELRSSRRTMIDRSMSTFHRANKCYYTRASFARLHENVSFSFLLAAAPEVPERVVASRYSPLSSSTAVKL